MASDRRNWLRIIDPVKGVQQKALLPCLSCAYAYIISFMCMFAVCFSRVAKRLPLKLAAEFWSIGIGIVRFSLQLRRCYRHVFRCLISCAVFVVCHAIPSLQT
mmetsp:Transcript_110648/g.174371  ORF Transcript_110648/g.174371 Transcript_110648/m.174371 type:complete len:103 (-) Transcript_110648:396-704(-)